MSLRRGPVRSDPARSDPARALRAGLVALTVVSILATGFELATERHWNGVEQLIPWAALAMLVLGVVAFLVPTRGGVACSRVLAVVVLAASLYGVVDHVLVNHGSGELDQRYAAVWEDLPAGEKWWLAATKTVGPSPTLAPGVLGMSSMLLLLAGVGRPVRARR